MAHWARIVEKALSVVRRTIAAWLGARLRYRDIAQQAARQPARCTAEGTGPTGVSDKGLSERLARDQLIPVVHGTTWKAVRDVSPLLGSRNGLNTAEDSMEVIAIKIAELVRR
jgi:hypothetical protein